MANPVIRNLIISKKKGIAIFLLLILLVFVLGASAGVFLTTPQDRFVIVRVDDIQDFAFKDAQLFLLEHSTSTNLPLSLAVIAGMFGEDTEILEAMRLAVASGCEVGVHGWEHEKLTSLPMTEQMDILFRAKIRIKDLIGVDTQLLIPPMFSYDNNTVTAMCQESFNIVSTCTDYHEPSSISGITNIPATVELSTLSNDVWRMKNIDTLTAEVEKSFELYGYAALITHPQEFISNGQINQTAKESYMNLLAKLSETCHFTTFVDLYRQKLMD